MTERRKSSNAGSVIGVALGFSFLLNTILFSNVTFVVDRIVRLTNWSACLFLCLLLLGSIAALFKPLKTELKQIACIRRLCCPREITLKSYRIRNSQ